MGQYHGIYNKTKREYFSLGGAKLWEKAYCVPAAMGLLVLLSNSNGRGGGDLNNPIFPDYEYPKAGKPRIKGYKIWSNEKQKYLKKTKTQFDSIEYALRAVSGRWAGDELVVQGDYAKETDPSFIPESDRDEYTDITGLVVAAFEACLGVDSDASEILKTLADERRYSNGRF